MKISSRSVFLTFAVLAGLGFVVITYLVIIKHPWLAETDVIVMRSVAALGGSHPLLSGVAEASSFLARTFFAVVLSVIFWVRGAKRIAVAVVLAYLFSGAGVAVIKLLTMRARPEIIPVSDPEYSFPSGHVAQGVAAYGLLAYLAVRSRLGEAAKAASVTLVIIFLVLVSVSRVVLGFHWLSDVTAGLGLGFLVFFAMIAWLETGDRPDNLPVFAPLILFLAILTAGLVSGHLAPYPEVKVL